MAELLVVAICGGLGTVLRSVLGKFNGFIHWGILIANTAATALAAWVLVAAPQLGLILVAGVAGGLSTFSTFVQQTWQLLNQGKRIEAFVNLVFNIVLPSTAVALVMLCL